MSLCGILTSGSQYDCNNPIQPGLLPQIILFNRTDIIDYTVVGNVITDINLKSGKVGYLFETIRQGLDARFEKLDAGLQAGYSHQTTFQIHNISSEQKEEIRKLSLNKLVAVVFNQPVAGNDDSYFEIFGAQTGMQSLEITRGNRDLETAGAFNIILETPEDVRESKIPYTFFDTDYTTSLNKLLSYLATGAGFPYTLPYILS